MFCGDFDFCALCDDFCSCCADDGFEDSLNWFFQLVVDVVCSIDLEVVFDGVEGIFGHVCDFCGLWSVDDDEWDAITEHDPFPAFSELQ